MASVYISIFGFVLVTANSMILFHRFTQKAKLLWIHVIFFLTFFISSIVTLTNSTYDDHMDHLGTLTYSSAVCSLNGYVNECLLARSYKEYRGHYVSFLVVFTLFFLGYTAVYHYAVLKVLSLIPE